METAIAKQIENHCLLLLARREHSRLELLDKLALKGFSREASLAVIEQLAAQGWQCDNRYAESYARHRINRGFGPIAIAYELNRNGITDIDLEQVAQSVAGSWQTVLADVYQKKYHDDPPADTNDWAKRSRFLMQRGFPAGMVNTFLVGLHGRKFGSGKK